MIASYNKVITGASQYIAGFHHPKTPQPTKRVYRKACRRVTHTARTDNELVPRRYGHDLRHDADDVVALRPSGFASRRRRAHVYRRARGDTLATTMWRARDGYAVWRVPPSGISLHICAHSTLRCIWCNASLECVCVCTIVYSPATTSSARMMQSRCNQSATTSAI